MRRNAVYVCLDRFRTSRELASKSLDIRAFVAVQAVAEVGRRGRDVSLWASIKLRIFPPVHHLPFPRCSTRDRSSGPYHSLAVRALLGSTLKAAHLPTAVAHLVTPATVR